MNPAFILKRRNLLGGGALVLLLGPPQLAFGATVMAVRLWPSPQYTRLTIETDTRLNVQHTYSDFPPRMVLDIDDLALAGALAEVSAKIHADDPVVAGIKLLPGQANTLRVVIDLKQPVSPQIFALNPIANYAHRLVVDLYGTEVRDPLGDLISSQLLRKSGPEAMTPAPSGQTSTSLSPSPPPAQLQRPRLDLKPAPSKPPTTASKPRAASPIVRSVMVVIDPGHGGEDPGAIGPAGTKEKDVVLSIAKKLHEKIGQTQIPGMVVRSYMTRDSDYFVPLKLRVEKAQGLNADLFISIHADAYSVQSARGASVFALSQRGASSATAKWMAEKENRADLIGGINLKSRDATVQRVVLDMSTTAQIRDSLKVGGLLLAQVGKITALHKNNVEQAGFAVLKAPDIPSVLIETAFISNPDEEALLRSEAHQDELVRALMKGIESFFLKHPPRAKTRLT
jgi:N-acetylmuramoyl-L-alanine amidase